MPSSQWRGAPAWPLLGRGQTPPRPTDTSRPDCERVEEGTGWSRWLVGWRGPWDMLAGAPIVGNPKKTPRWQAPGAELASQPMRTVFVAAYPAVQHRHP